LYSKLALVYVSLMSIVTLVRA